MGCLPGLSILAGEFVLQCVPYLLSLCVCVVCCFVCVCCVWCVFLLPFLRCNRRRYTKGDRNFVVQVGSHKEVGIGKSRDKVMQMNA